MTAGRGWIALALVVFASWRPAGVVAGAYLFGARGGPGSSPSRGSACRIPPSCMSSLPYLATVLVLVVFRDARTCRVGRAASLGVVFVPDR